MTAEPLEHAQRAEDANLFRLLVDRVLDYAIFLLTPEGIIESWNAGAERLKQYTADEIIGQSFERFYTREDRTRGLPQRLLDAALAAGRVENEGWRVRKDGSRFWANVVITALRDQDGQLLGFAKVTRDLTERRSVEERLRQSELRFRTLVDSVKDYAIFVLSPDGIVLTWNQGAERLKGYTSDEIIGHSFERFYLAEDVANGRPRQLLATAEAEGRIEQEGLRVRKDGSQFWADVVITALRDQDGQLLGFAKVTRDLTERRRIEEERARRLAAERATDRIERLQMATAALAAATQQQHAIEVLTDVAINALGGAGGALHLPTGHGEQLELAYSHGFQSAGLPVSPITGPAFSELPDGGSAAVPLVAEGHLLGVLSVSFDRAVGLDSDERGLLLALAEVGAQALDRARLYEAEQRARSEAEEAVRAQDEFLSVASHELRTPVTAVKATAQLAQRAIQRNQFDPTRVLRQLESIARAADRLAALVEDLLDVSRLRTGQLQLHRQEVELHELVREIVARHAATSGARDFRVELDEDAPHVHADPLRLEQVLDNLLSNAVKYSPRGGAIEIGARPVDDGVTITVTDHGIGLPAGQEVRIFEPFGRASNAAAQQIPGLGLGLAICQQLVEAHGGRIWAESPGEHQGSTFGIWLPTHAEATDSFPSASSESE